MVAASAAQSTTASAAKGGAAIRTKARATARCRSARALQKTFGFDAPVYFNNPKFWASTPSGHHQRHAGPAAAKSKPAAGSPKHASSASDDDVDDVDDDDDDDE